MTIPTSWKDPKFKVPATKGYVMRFFEMAVNSLTERIVELSSGHGGRLDNLEARLKALEGDAGIEPPAQRKAVNAGDIVENSGGRYEYRGDGRYRRLDDA